MLLNAKLYKLGRLTLILDPSEVFADDPGAGTPAVVYIGAHAYTNGSPHPNAYIASATYWCAIEEGAIEGYKLCRVEMEWLLQMELKVQQLYL